MWADGSAARAQCGRAGAWLGLLSSAPWHEARAAARRIEELGFTTLWIAEGPAAKESFSHAGLLLEATKEVVVATGIANIWARDATGARNAALTLGEAHPGRFALGLGVSHRPLVDTRGHNYAKPLTAMREYLDALDAVDYTGPLPAEPVPLVIAGLRDRMIGLGGQRASGVHPYLTTVEHTARARQVLGPEPFLAPEVSCVIDSDSNRARTRARSFTRSYLEMPNYRRHLRELGFADEELDDGGSDRLVDAVIAHGDERQAATRLREHLDAGADHVAIQPVGTSLSQSLVELAQLAPLLTE